MGSFFSEGELSGAGLVPLDTMAQGKKNSFAMPASDVWETGKEFKAEIDLPGIKKEENRQ